tara:strand:- start:876 stop:1301 length:426 start_codon:yes stop_codon:yes gene_type:complete
MAYFQVTHIATELTGTFQAGTRRGACLEAASIWGNQVRGMGSEWTAVKTKAPKKIAEPQIMKTYYIIGEKYENDNTPEFGYGDYPRRTPYIAMTLQAETKRKAQNIAKKTSSRFTFGGMFGNQVYTDADLPSYIAKDLEVV